MSDYYLNLVRDVMRTWKGKPLALAEIVPETVRQHPQLFTLDHIQELRSAVDTLIMWSEIVPTSNYTGFVSASSLKTQNK